MVILVCTAPRLEGGYGKYHARVETENKTDDPLAAPRAGEAADAVGADSGRTGLYFVPCGDGNGIHCRKPYSEDAPPDVMPPPA